MTAWAQAQTYNVTLDAFVIGGAPTTVRAGTPLSYSARNLGPAGDPNARYAHNLSIEGPGGVINAPQANITGQQAGTFTFPALQPGNYVLFCPTSNGFHRNAGMAANFTVVAGASALPATGGFGVPAGLAIAGLTSGMAGLFLRRRAT